MAELELSVAGARPDPYAAVPTLLFQVRVREVSGVDLHAMTLRTQIRIEPQRRRYDAGDAGRLFELFGSSGQWGETLKPFLWAHVDRVVPGFTGATEVDLPLVCTYDFEVATAKYLHALRDGDVPLLFLFSGTLLARSPAGGVTVEPIAWHHEAAYRLPVATWRAMMDLYFPASGWLRLPIETLDALQDFKSRRALPTWQQALEVLLKEAGAE